MLNRMKNACADFVAITELENFRVFVSALTASLMLALILLPIAALYSSGGNLACYNFFDYVVGYGAISLVVFLVVNFGFVASKRYK